MLTVFFDISSVSINLSLFNLFDETVHQTFNEMNLFDEGKAMAGF